VATVEKRVIVIGGGAAGMLAAGRAAEAGARVLLLEKTASPGKKVLITGQGRCNLTNTRELDDFITAYGPNGRFLYSAFHTFFRDELLALLLRHGTPTKVEADGRVLPASEDARTVVAALMRYLNEGGVEVLPAMAVTGLMTESGRMTGIQVGTETIPARVVILATGGSSYAATGSSGDGYRLAQAVGHTIVPLRPALVPLEVAETELVRSMQGSSLRGVRLTSFRCPASEIDIALVPSIDAGRGIPGKPPRPPVIESRTGDIMLAHFGLSGPTPIDMSLAVVDALAEGPVSVAIDLKPEYPMIEMRRRLQDDLDRFGRRSLGGIMGGLLLPKMNEPLLRLAKVPATRAGFQVNADERERLLGVLKSLRFDVKGTLPMGAAMVTAGGVALPEIDPRTMASRLVGGLFFSGEVMDIDGLSGGYNLQAAFSTGHLAVESAASYLNTLP
jgi:predicted flavoprotein YhiN